MTSKWFDHAFCLLGPYSYLGGAMALDFGGKRGGAISSGIIDGVGYLGYTTRIRASLSHE